MHELPFLKPGDGVKIVAPASQCTEEQLASLNKLLLSWKLNVISDSNMFGPDLLCANTDNMRLSQLKNALQNPEIKAIICVRGGYGSLRLIPELVNITPPLSPKLFVGMSDITALQLFFEQEWGWPSILGSLATDKFSPESINTMKSMLFDEKAKVTLTGLPLNKHAEKNHFLEAPITGGNLSLVQTSIGTRWQIDGHDKFIFLEDVSERGYRIDRMLEHMRQANLFTGTKAIIFGDFIKGNEPNGTCLIKPVLERFAQSIDIPAVQVTGVGHDYINYPLLLGTKAKLKLGDSIQLTYSR